MDTTRRTILRGMAAAPAIATAGGLLLPETATAASAQPPLYLTYKPEETAAYVAGIRWLIRQHGNRRYDARFIPLPVTGSWAFQQVPVDEVPGWPSKTPHPVRAYGWSPNDPDANIKSRGWWPQGVTTYYDATGLDGTRMMVSWYNKDNDKGARVALIDRNESNPRYHYIKLVKAKRVGGGAYTAEPIEGLHAGGLAWYGNRLYVTDSEQKALLVFNTDDIFRTGDPQAPYSMPLSRTYRANKYTRTQLRFSQVSVDRTSLASPFRRTTLIVSGWKKDDKPQIIGRWSFAYNSGSLLLDTGTTARSADVYKIHRGSGLPNGFGIQGAVTVDNTMYLSVSRGKKPGAFGAAPLRQNGEGKAVEKWRVPRGPEDLSYDGRNRWMWGLGEYVGYRNVYAMRV